jgi:betaine-aldehyde dehydrogenase
MMRIAREEIFGPVMSVLAFRTRRKYRTRQRHRIGLSAGIFTRDLPRAHRIGELQAGTRWINTYNPGRCPLAA